MILNRLSGRSNWSIFAVFALVFTLFSFSNTATAQDGKALFSSNCASCHHPTKDVTGPALKGVSEKVPSKEWLYKWVQNSTALVASGDKYANEVFNKWNKIPMPAFSNLSEKDIDAIIAYVDAYEAPGAGDKKKDVQTAPESDNTWLYTIITIGLAFLVIVLWRINAAMEKAANDKQGLKTPRPIPVTRNKIFVAVAGILILSLGGYWVANGSIEMGRQQNYMPEQPIFYSHKVHAGINQINCE